MIVGKGKHEAKIQNRISIEVGIKVSSLGNGFKANANAEVGHLLLPSFLLLFLKFLLPQVPFPAFRFVDSDMPISTPDT